MSELKQDAELELRVWWVPQIPMKSFHYIVPTVEAGKMLLDVLAKYDMFQYENNVKPDYCNAGGLAWRHPVHTEGEWYDFDPEDEDELAEVIEAGAVLPSCARLLRTNPCSGTKPNGKRRT